MVALASSSLMPDITERSTPSLGSLDSNIFSPTVSYVLSFITYVCVAVSLLADLYVNEYLATLSLGNNSVLILLPNFTLASIDLLGSTELGPDIILVKRLASDNANTFTNAPSSVARLLWIVRDALSKLPYVVLGSMRVISATLTISLCLWLSNSIMSLMWVLIPCIIDPNESALAAIGHA